MGGFYPSRRKRPKMQAAKPDAPIVCPGHTKWVRGHECLIAPKYAAALHQCSGRIEAHHVKTRGAGGGDEQVVPLCSSAHQVLHAVGHETFQRTHRIDLALIAKRLWQASPHRVAYERRISAPTSLPSPTPTNEGT